MILAGKSWWDAPEFCQNVMPEKADEKAKHLLLLTQN